MMFQKDFSLCALFDRYGALLTEKQRTAFSLYYNEDFSLSEIAEHTLTSRQAVRQLISKTEEQLEKFESSLRLCHKEEVILNLLSDVETGRLADPNVALREISAVIKE